MRKWITGLSNAKPTNRELRVMAAHISALIRRCRIQWQRHSIAVADHAVTSHSSPWSDCVLQTQVYRGYFCRIIMPDCAKLSIHCNKGSRIMNFVPCTRPPISRLVTEISDLTLLISRELQMTLFATLCWTRVINYALTQVLFVLARLTPKTPHSRQ